MTMKIDNQNVYSTAVESFVRQLTHTAESKTEFSSVEILKAMDVDQDGVINIEKDNVALQTQFPQAYGPDPSYFVAPFTVCLDFIAGIEMRAGYPGWGIVTSRSKDQIYVSFADTVYQGLDRDLSRDVHALAAASTSCYDPCFTVGASKDQIYYYLFVNPDAKDEVFLSIGITGNPPFKEETVPLKDLIAHNADVNPFYDEASSYHDNLLSNDLKRYLWDFVE